MCQYNAEHVDGSLRSILLLKTTGIIMKLRVTLWCLILASTYGLFAQNAEKPTMPKLGQETSSDEAHALIGTWRLMEFADLGKDGKWVYWFGEHPRGYFVYDASGHVHI